MAKEKKVYDGSISDLQYDDKNFNRHTQQGMDMLATSVGNNGFGRSVLVDKDNRLIAGNGIVETADKLGKTKIKVIETTGDELVVVKRTDLSLDSKEGREMAAADNATAAVDLDWDEDNLREMRDKFGMDLEAYGIELEPMDMDGSDEDDETPSASDVEEDDYDEDVDKAPVKTIRGDMWLCGKHRVICGDSTDADTILRLMSGETADLLLTDPPYNVAYNKGSHDAIANDNMESGAFFDFLLSAFKAAVAVMDAGAGAYIWYALSEHTNFNKAAEEAGLKVSEHLIWVKNQFVLARHDYHYRHEPCIYGWKMGAAHRWYGDRSQSTVLEFPKPQKSVDHPTMKPVPLFAYQMENSSKAGDIVLDLFGGSGTTMVAAENLNRKARLCEFEPHYVDVILDRYAKLVGSDKDIYLLHEDGTKTPYAEVTAER